MAIAARILLVAGVAVVSCHANISAAQLQAEAKRGAQAFKVCAACHSLEPGQHLTGPSLGNLMGRKAGAVPGFLRYSDALKRSGIEWDDKALDTWLADPAKFIPGNEMPFPGIKDERTRRDLIAYLRAADSLPAAQRSGPKLPDLKQASADSIVKAIRHCGDTYFVTTGDGKVEKIWEFSLRIKTDTSKSGPAPGRPVLIGVGMRGDRAAVVFASPREFGGFIRERCD